LLDYLAHFKKINHPADRDRIKHSPLPPISFNIDAKFVYVYGNPQLATISLFQRGLHHPHSMKLQQWIGKGTSPIPKEMTLQEYASIGSDRLYFKNHFYNWYHKYLATIPTLFIRYETLFDNVEFLLDFLDIPKTSIDSFPQKKERSSSISDIPVETRKQLDVMYGDFSSELSRLDDVEIRQAGNRKMFSMAYLTTPYIRAIAAQFLYYCKGLLRSHSPRIYRMLKNIKQLTRRST
jgi:hypothetical protein